MSPKKHIGIGLMSGTSLDGLDIALCSFLEKDEEWGFEILEAETVSFKKELAEKLISAHKLSAIELFQLDRDFGKWLGEQTKLFIEKTEIIPDFVASHGQTIFHKPENNLTVQIGHGASLAVNCGVKVICDFRSSDVASGGQGAPLVPIGDKLLFGEYDYCINLGGFANCSFDRNNERIAFDICPVNYVANYLIQKTGLPFDEDGKTGAKGEVDNILLNQLNNISFYKKSPPKSLGREWVENEFFPIMEKNKISLPDKLCTLYEHIALQIGKTVATSENRRKILLTGGGAHNKYLIKRIIFYSKMEIIIPNKTIIDHKESLIFAFLGLLRTQKRANCLSKSTGAKKNSCGGAIYLP